MEISALKAFVKVVDCKNISRAAKELFISQPALSKKISDLEKELNIALLVRDNRSLSVTKAGEILYRKGKEIIDSMDDLEEEILNLSKQEKSTIRIGLSGIERSFLPNIIRNFHLDFPEIEYDMTYGNSGKIKQYLEDNLIDVGFLLDFDAASLNGYDSRIISKAKYCVLLPQDHFLSDEESLKIEQLQGEKVITFSSASSLNHTLKVFKESNLDPLKIILKDQVEDVVMCVESGMGIGILLENVRSIFPNANVSFKDLIDDLYINYVCAVWRERKDDTLIHKFLNYVSDSVSKMS